MLCCENGVPDSFDDFLEFKAIPKFCEKGRSFISKRTQFPVVPAFTVTINKSQGLKFDKVGFYLTSDVFAHGLLYVALSRTKTPDSIRIFSDNGAIKKGA